VYGGPTTTNTTQSTNQSIHQSINQCRSNEDCNARSTKVLPPEGSLAGKERTSKMRDAETTSSGDAFQIIWAWLPMFEDGAQIVNNCWKLKKSLNDK